MELKHKHWNICALDLHITMPCTDKRLYPQSQHLTRVRWLHRAHGFADMRVSYLCRPVMNRSRCVKNVVGCRSYQVGFAALSAGTSGCWSSKPHMHRRAMRTIKISSWLPGWFLRGILQLGLGRPRGERKFCCSQLNKYIDPTSHSSPLLCYSKHIREGIFQQVENGKNCTWKKLRGRKHSGLAVSGLSG